MEVGEHASSVLARLYGLEENGVLKTKSLGNQILYSMDPGYRKEYEKQLREEPIEKLIVCNLCRGTAFDPRYQHRIVCCLCHGNGEYFTDSKRTRECPQCKGEGRDRRYSSQLCQKCGGYGLVEPLTQSTASGDAGGLEVVHIEAGKPRTAHLEIVDILSTLSGEIRICDPYYGKGTLIRLDELTQCSKVNLLTKKPDSKDKIHLPQLINDFTTEHSQFEFRKNVGNDLHDRFVLTNDELILLGQGLKDVGGKQSFVVRISHDAVSEILDGVRKSFDAKWQNAKPLLGEDAVG
jgi:hypothetical protein